MGGGAIPQADLDALMQSVTYENIGQVPMPGDRTLTFTAKDLSNLSSTPAVATITVVPVNDPPVATDNAKAATEDLPVTGNVLTDVLADSDIEAIRLK